MNFLELSHIGEFHINHNEDFHVLEDSGLTRKLIAVMDGCSSGTDSHFASTLIGKILRKLAKQEAYKEYALGKTAPLKTQLETVSLQLFEELRDVSRSLDLRSDEILSTLILGIVDLAETTAELVIVGDGLVHANGKVFEYENDNKPDYIGYHLNMDKHQWYKLQTTKQSIDEVEDLTISTDGIHTFKNHDGKNYPRLEDSEIMKKFFVETKGVDNQNMLKKTLIRIKDDYGLMPSDDLTMIRVISCAI